MRLAGWQTVAAGWVLGPNLALSTSRWVHPNITLGGMVVGGGLGAGSAILYADRRGLGRADTAVIVSSQQLGIFNGIALSELIDDTRFTWPAGLAAGWALGTAAGYGVATLPLDDGRMVGLHSGAFWGTAAGLVVMGAAWGDGWEDRTVVPFLALASDVGAAAGLGVAAATDLGVEEVRVVNTGGVLGTLGALALIGLTANSVDWSTEAAYIFLGAGGLAGGGVALTIMRAHPPELHVGALVSGTGRQVSLGLPLPSAWRSNEGWHGRASLVEYRF